jgi:hypothetical protein
VIDFHRHVFDAFDPGAVKDFVHEDYVQHCRHMPAGRAGLEQHQQDRAAEARLADAPRT